MEYDREHQIHAIKNTPDINDANGQHARLRHASSPSLDLNNNSIKLTGVNSNSMNGGNGGGIVGRDESELTRKRTLQTLQNFSRQTHGARTMSTGNIEITLDSTISKPGNQVEKTLQITQIDSPFGSDEKVKPERTKIPRTHMTDKSAQYATQAYFKDGDCNAPAYVESKIPERSKDTRKKLQMHQFENSNTYTYGNGQHGDGSGRRLSSIEKGQTITALDLSYFTNDRIGSIIESPRNETGIITYTARLSNATINTNNTNGTGGRNHRKQESGGRSITSVPSTNSSDQAKQHSTIVYEFDNVVVTLSIKIDELKKLCDECGIAVPENLPLHQQQQLQLRIARFFKAYDRHKIELMFGGSDRLKLLQQHLSKMLYNNDIRQNTTNNKDKDETKKEMKRKKIKLMVVMEIMVIVVIIVVVEL